MENTPTLDRTGTGKYHPTKQNGRSTDMTTRMERVVEDVALAVLRKASTAAEPPLQQEKLKKGFQAKWLTTGSLLPMNDAMNAATQAASTSSGQYTDRWKTTVSDVWQTAVQETIEGYFKAARHSFEQGEALEGVETLTDAVRASLDHIAAVRNWPHRTHDDLYAIAAALGSGTGWPSTMQEFDQALDNCSEEGKHLGSALGASMGLPSSIRFGTYAEEPESAEENGPILRRNRHRTRQPAGRAGARQRMNEDEHTQEARELIRRADEESTDGGNERIAAELLWGAFAHCLITVASKRWTAP